MYIKSLGIRNFRNFRTAKFHFVDKSVNTILGENASGKTNVFHAMRLVLDDSLPRNAGFLSANDFNRELGEIRGHWIIIELTFGGLGLADEDLVMANHVLEGESGELEGTYTFVYRPKIHIRQELFNISQAEPIEANRLQAIEDYLKTLTISKDDYEAVAFTRTTVDFTNDNIYTRLVGDFTNGVFPNPQDEDSALIGSPKPAYFSLIKEVTCTYVKALRNVVNDLKYAKTNPLYRLLSYKSTEITGAEAITDNVKKLNADISNLEQVKDLSESIARTLTGAVGQTYSPDISISSDLPEEITELVQSLSLLVEDSLGYQGTGNIEDLSLGGANLIYLALKLYEYEMQQEKDDKIAHFLLIEEPEAHIHNHIQKTLFSNFESSNTQLFISTHSTQISSVAKISSMNMISRKSHGSEVFWPANGLDPASAIGVERYLDAMRSTLLFAKSVMLVEGDAEKILIPQLVKKILGVSLDEMGISLVNMDSTVFIHISSLFHSERIRNYCSILTDRDASFLSEITDYANTEYIAGLVRAEESGARREIALNAHCDGNDYLSVYFASNTFETELILAGNTDLFIGVLPKLYSQQARIKQWTDDLNNADPSRLCHAALFLANKVGKGWFSITLSEHITSDSNIPQYILEGIAHALTSHDRQPIYEKIMDYRLRKVGQTYDELRNSSDSWEDCIIAFRGIRPQDPLLSLIDME